MRAIKPIGDKVMLARVRRKNASVNGVIVLDTAVLETERIEFVVIEAGPRATQFRQGQRVLAPRFIGTDIRFGDETYTLAKASELEAIVEG
jgi:co-chaperonin GroES (HSP10)